MIDFAETFNTPIPIIEGGRDSGKFSPDAFLVCAVINHLYSQSPERFGPKEVREQLITDIAQYIEAAEKHKNPYRITCFGILEFLGNKFEEYGINPLQNTRIAFVGAREDIVSDTAKKIRECFSDFTDIQATRGNILCLSNWQEYITEGKFDYVLTGNVLNDPKNFLSDYVQMACGCLLKQGGHAFHALTYSHDNNQKTFSKVIHTLSGQRLLGSLLEKEGSSVFNDDCVALAVFKQEKEISLTMKHGSWQRTYMYGDLEKLHPVIRFFIDRPELIEKVSFDRFLLHEGQLIIRRGLEEDVEISEEEAYEILQSLDPNYCPPTMQPASTTEKQATPDKLELQN